MYVYRLRRRFLYDDAAKFEICSRHVSPGDDKHMTDESNIDQESGTVYGVACVGIRRRLVGNLVYTAH